jgi:hypothetical protein
MLTRRGEVIRVAEEYEWWEPDGSALPDWHCGNDIIATLGLEAVRDAPVTITPERVLLNECVQAAALAGCESPGAPSAPAIQAMVRVLTKGLSGPEVRAVLQRAGIGEGNV